MQLPEIPCQGAGARSNTQCASCSDRLEQTPCRLHSIAKRLSELLSQQLTVYISLPVARRSVQVHHRQPDTYCRSRKAAEGGSGQANTQEGGGRRRRCPHARHRLGGGLRRDLEPGRRVLPAHGGAQGRAGMLRAAVGRAAEPHCREGASVNSTISTAALRNLSRLTGCIAEDACLCSIRYGTVFHCTASAYTD